MLEPGPLGQPAGAGVAGGREQVEAAGSEPSVRRTAQRPPGHQAQRGRHHATPSASGVRPVPDLRGQVVAVVLELEQRHVAQRQIGRRVGHAPRHAAVRRGAEVDPGQVARHGFERPRQRGVWEPVAQHRVVRGLDQPRTVVLAPRPKSHAVRLQHRWHQPRLDRVPWVFRPEPGRPRITAFPPLRQQPRDGGPESEPERPHVPARCPVPYERPPVHHLEAPAETPVEREVERPAHHAATPRVRVQPEAELGHTVSAHPEVDRPREPALVLDREAVRRLVGPARGHDRGGPLDGVLLRVRRRHGRPRDRFRVGALLDDAGHVRGAVGPQRHHAVAQGRHVVGESHRASLSDTTTAGRPGLCRLVSGATAVGAVGQD